MRLSDSFLELLSRREPVGVVPALRVSLAAASLLQLAELAPVLRELAGGEVLRTPYLPVGPDLSPAAVPWWSGFWALCALASLLGWRLGVCLPALATVELATLLYDQQLYSNHFYLLTLLTLLLALTYRQGTSATGSEETTGPGTVPSWPLILMRTQLTSVYLFAGLSKINQDFLSGRVLEHYLGGSALGGRHVWDRPEVLGPAALAIVATEIFLAVGLWLPPSRRVAMTVGLLFHVSILVALGPSIGLVIFALESLALYPLFLTTPSFRGDPARLARRATG